MLARTRTGNNRIFVTPNEDGPIGDQGEGLYCFKIKVKIHDVLNNGVEFATRVADARDAKNELYSLHFKEGSNVLQFFKPSMDMAFRADKAFWDERILIEDNGGHPDDAFLVDGRDAARVAFEKAIASKPDLAKKMFEVCLQSVSFKLSQRPFDLPAGKPDGYTKAACKTVMYRTPFQPALDAHERATAAHVAGVGADPGVFHQPTYNAFLSWRFVDLATEQELTLGGNTAAAALAAGFAGL